jgi:hypothetical protein
MLLLHAIQLQLVSQFHVPVGFPVQLIAVVATRMMWNALLHVIQSMIFNVGTLLLLRSVQRCRILSVLQEGSGQHLL